MIAALRSFWLLVISLGLPVLGSAQVLFELEQLNVAPGETGGRMALSILPVADEVHGYGLALRFDPRVIAFSGFESALETDFLQFHSSDAFTEPGTIGLGVVYTFTEDRQRILTPARSGNVGVLRFCILPDATEGRYPIDFLPEVQTTRGTFVWTAYTTMAEVEPGQPPEPVSRQPQVRAGELRVSGKPRSGGSCPEVGPGPPDPVVSYALGGPSSVFPGQEFSVDWTITTNTDLYGYTAAIGFDSAAFSLRDVIVNGEWLGPSLSIDWRCGASNQAAFFVVPGLDDGYYLPAGDGRLAGRLVFQVLDEVAVDRSQVAFIHAAQCERDASEVPEGANPALRAENRVGLTINADSPDPVLDSLEIEVPAAGQGIMLAIVSNREFLRGDVDRNGRVQLTDGVALLNFLFLGGQRPPCLDAADSDDSGRLDLTDALGILNFLFLGGTRLAAPGPEEAGQDPTPDTLGCAG
jgi:hypothetical protein